MISTHETFTYGHPMGVRKKMCISPGIPKDFFSMKPKPTPLPIGNRICISQRPEDAAPSKELQVVGGIVIPEMAATGKIVEPYYEATVLAVGPDCKQIKKGDRIILPRGMDWEVKINGKLVATMVRENECVMIVK